MTHPLQVTGLIIWLSAFTQLHAQNKDPLQTEIVTTDIENFWLAYAKAKPDFDPEIFQQHYLNKGTPGLRYFLKTKIKSADRISKVIASHPHYFEALKSVTDSIYLMKEPIRQSLVKLKELCPRAIFPPVYMLIGAMNSGGTSSDDGLLIGVDMYGLTPNTDLSEMSDWHRAVLKPVSEIPHIVAHELIHYQQRYDQRTLLGACLREGSADFVAELISGKHINHHVHDFANPREKELWLEFREIMNNNDSNGWLYSSVNGRPNDLGYWMGYQITKAYYDNAVDKQKAIDEIFHIKNAEMFLATSGYAKRFE